MTSVRLRELRQTGLQRSDAKTSIFMNIVVFTQVSTGNDFDFFLEGCNLGVVGAVSELSLLFRGNYLQDSRREGGNYPQNF